ncbi:hypothetical protein [Ruegeria atlantica]|uniref:Uncharacterized protein n=1 Tax=Ruegeria atlantica TaxID=81569 RepID=A0A0P1EHG0_9RHOB|nr:hypothetical protein [Ruegeria atlantica]CUH49823.1 hypothetical protein RUA4292_04023 [Ruegeria atlantica]
MSRVYQLQVQSVDPYLQCCIDAFPQQKTDQGKQSDIRYNDLAEKAEHYAEHYSGSTLSITMKLKRKSFDDT